MAIANNDQINAFKQAALTQGYDPAEVESFAAMAAAASTAKQAAADTARSTELQDYETKLKLQKQYSTAESDKAFDPNTDAVIQRQLYLSKLEGKYDPKNDPIVQRQLYLDSIQKTGKELSQSELKAIEEGVATMQLDEATGTYKVVPKKIGSGDGKVLGYVDQLQNGTAKSIKDVPAEDRGAVVEYLKSNNIDIYQLQKNREGKSAMNLIGGLYNDFYGENGRGSGDDLSGKGLLSLGIPSLIIRGRAAMGLGKAANYKSTKDALVASLKSITGDNGVLTDQDVERINKLMPNAGANPDYAQRQWEKVNKILVDKYGKGFLPDQIGITDVNSSKSSSTKPGLNDVGGTDSLMNKYWK